MGKKIITAIVLSILIISSVSYAIHSKSKRDLESELTKYGQITKDRIESKKGNRIEVMKGEQIVIYKGDYDAVTRELINIGVEEKQAKSDAEKMLLRKEALYILARNKGIEVSDQEVLDVIKVNKQQSKKASNYDTFVTFLDGADMTLGEYWDSQFDSLKKSMTVSKYKEEYLKSSDKYGEFEIGTPEYNLSVEKEFNKIADDFIEKDNVVSLD